MRKFKKVVALTAASSLALGSVASAAYTDADDISKSTAVDTLTALSVIGGYEDGSFQPEGIVTRAEMAKMIYMIQAGGEDNSSFFKQETKFTDVSADHWASGYVNYCVGAGIIVGMTETEFYPNATVKSVDALKMILVALGYNAENVGLVGSNYAINTLTYAQKAGLFSNYSVEAQDGLTREFAAQALYNALDAAMVSTDSDGNVTEKDYTFAESSFALAEASVILNDVTDGATYNVKNGDDTIELEVETDLSEFLGQKVTIQYSSKQEAIYGVTPNYKSTEVVYNSADVDVSGNDIEIGDIEIDLASSDDLTLIVVDSAAGATKTLSATAANVTAALTTADAVANTIVAYDNGDDQYSIVVYKEYIKKVTSVSSTRINAGGYYTFEDNDIYSSVATGDYVLVSYDAYDDNAVISEVDLVESALSGYKTTEVLISGAWYDLSGSYSGIGAGDTIQYVEYNGVLYQVSEVDEESATGDYLMITGIPGYDSRYDEFYVKVTFADGTESTIIVDEELEVEGSDTVDLTDDNMGASLVNGIYSYTASNSVYSLTKITAAGDFVDVNTTFSADDVIASSTINDDAVIFVKHSTSKFDVITGKELIDAKLTDKNAVGFMLEEEVNGLDFVTVAYFDIGAENIDVKAEASDYAYVIDAGYSTVRDGDTVWTLTIFDGEDEITVYTTDDNADYTTASGLAKGDVIKIDLDDDGVTLNDVEAVAVTTGYNVLAYYAVMGYSSSTGVIKLGTTSDSASGSTTTALDDLAEINDDTVILYVNSADVEGASEGYSIQKADDNDADGYTENVMAIVNASNEVVLIVVDVNNAIVGGTDMDGDTIKK